MQYEIRTLGENCSVKIATVRLNGEFSFNDGSAFWNACEPEKQQCQVYYFDLSEVTVLRRDGLTWLRVFLCWARECGRSVRFINTSNELQEHLAAAGISMEGTATERAARPPSAKRRQQFSATGGLGRGTAQCQASGGAAFRLMGPGRPFSGSVSPIAPLGPPLNRRRFLSLSPVTRPDDPKPILPDPESRSGCDVGGRCLVLCCAPAVMPDVSAP